MTVLSPKQLTSLRESVGRVNLWEGSIRSGKTIASSLRWLLFIGAVRSSSGELVMVGRTRDSIWRNVILPLQDVSLFGPMAHQVIGNFGAPTVNILGRRVHVIGAADVKAAKVIQGMTVLGAYADEVTTLPEEFFTQLLGRMSAPQAKMFGTMNPDNPAHWIKRKYLDRVGAAGLSAWRRWHFTLEDNPSLTADYVTSIKSEYTGLWYRRFILGEWVAAEGAVYDMWDPDKMVIPHADIPTLRQLIAVGVDYGTTNATAALLLGQGLDGRLYLADEWRYDPQTARRRLTDSELATGLREWLDGLPERPKWVAVDPAAASFKVQLHNDGIRGLADADNDVSYGIRTVASLLASGNLKVSDSCSGFILEVPGYSWDPKATEKGEDKPIKTADHSLDAGRYAIATTESQWRRYLPRGE